MLLPKFLFIFIYILISYVYKVTKVTKVTVKYLKNHFLRFEKIRTDKRSCFNNNKNGNIKYCNNNYFCFTLNYHRN